MIGALARQVVNPRQAVQLVKVPARTIYPQLSNNVISGVPRNRIPFPEKVAGGVLIASLILATPAWIVTHMDDYRGGKAAGEE